MSLINKFPAYVKASWLADMEIDHFVTLSQEKIDLVLVLYQQLDIEFYKFRVATYSDPNFLRISNKLDTRKQHNA